MRPLIFAVLLLVGVGCADEPATVTVVDGVVTNALRPDTFFTARESWRLGSLEGEHTSFGRITGLAVSDEGQILVADGQVAEVQLFDADRNWVRTVGRAGQGPGELSQILGVGFAADRMWVHDFSGRMTLNFYHETGFEDAWTIQTESGRGIQPHWTRQGWLGTVAADIDPALAVPNAIIELPIEVWRLGPDGSPTEMVRQFPGSKLVLGSRGEGRRGPVLQPEPFTRLTPLGEILHGEGADYQFEVVKADGTTRLTVRRQVPPVPVTDVHRQDFEDAVRAFYQTVPDQPGVDDQIAGIMARSPVVEQVTPLTDVVGTADGGFWALRGDRGEVVALAMRAVFGSRGETVVTQWDRFDSQGGYVGSFELPEGFEPQQWEARAVVGVQLDELGVPYVVRYELVL